MFWFGLVLLHIYVLKFVCGWLGLESDGISCCPIVFHAYIPTWKIRKAGGAQAKQARKFEQGVWGGKFFVELTLKNLEL